MGGKRSSSSPLLLAELRDQKGCGTEMKAMRSKKPYTNSTFTKRVDYDAGRHRPPRAMSEPSVCEDCGAVYANRRWTAKDSESGDTKHQHWRAAQVTICPACRQSEPRGFVFLDGDFIPAHRKEIQQLIRNEAARAAEDNPLGRIIKSKSGEGHKLVVTTTTEHLAQRLGHALEKAFGGAIRYDFSHENKLARVHWQRD